jgi:hypothetical protein
MIRKRFILPPFDRPDSITPATKHAECHAGLDPASNLVLVPGFHRDDVWIPAFAGMTAFTYIVLLPE